MDNDSKNKLKDVLSTIDPVEFKWDETNTTVGVVAQEITNFTDTDTITLSGVSDTTFGDWGPAPSAMSGSVYSVGSNGINTFSFSAPKLNADTTEYGKTTIKTAKNTIDLDELADMMETLKKRLLILAPNFEMHEKYPMLKEMYDEYKAMEKLLGGPDTNE